TEAAGRIARLYAQMAHNTNLEVAVLTRLAVKFDYEQHDVKSLETYQEALALPEFQHVSPLLQSRVYAGLAATNAYCGQDSQALSFLSQAKDMYPEQPETDPGYLIDGGTGKQGFTIWEGLTLKYTGHYVEASNAFLRVGSLTPVPGLLENLRAEHLNYAASVAVGQRDLDKANFYLDTAEEVAWTIRHEQRLSEVRSTFREMQLLWPDEPQVRQLQEKMYARQM
ncbi:MAG: hypothetical protein ACRDHW_17360, partial [Ktedonobacteraceae bacterium]